MAPVVFVHGIAQSGRSAEAMEREWCSALAAGLVRAGHRRLADEVLRQNGPVRSAMCCYAPPPAGQQGGGPGDDLDDDELALAEEIAVEWLRYATGSPRLKDAREAELALHRLTAPAGGEQSVRSVTTRAVGLLDRVPYFTDAALGIATGLRINRSLAEVTCYLKRQSVRDEAIARCQALIDADTLVVIGHSLGSAVAYEALRGSPHPIRLLVTLGSPLGMRMFRTNLEQSCAWPTRLTSWVNMASKDDLVAARPDLSDFYWREAPPGAHFEQYLDVDNSGRPHRVGFYLEHEACGRAVAKALSGR